MCLEKKSKSLKVGSNGSSLAIALFFFMVCALMCAGLLFLASSTTHGVSKSYSYAESLVFVAPPTPTPTPTTTPTPTPDPAYQAEADAIDTIYSNLYYDFMNACLTADKGETAVIKNTPSNMSYEILSYIHSFYGDNGKVNVTNSNGVESISVPFTYEINGINVQALVEMSGTNGSKKNNGLRFSYIKITVSTPDIPECTYSPVFEYTVNNGKDGKLYFTWSGNGGKHFDLKNA